MKIYVLSDTHSREIPKSVVADLKKADLIIHAGDFCSIEDLNFLKKFSNLKAVHGNVDAADLKGSLPQKVVLKVEGLSIGVCHGEGQPSTILEHLQDVFCVDKVDIVIFGHSHCPFNEKIKGVLYFNPGSVTDKVRSPYRSYGLLEIKDGRVVEAQIIKVED
ncbi:MAG: metallophosphoesterase family protein [Candidatus Omnitrophica bacterium]|nr:metallophosphoesterase family protein [Candidatus Omnitrophota bacterium]